MDIHVDTSSLQDIYEQLQVLMTGTFQQLFATALLDASPSISQGSLANTAKEYATTQQLIVDGSKELFTKTYDFLVAIHGSFEQTDHDLAQSYSSHDLQP